MKQNLVIFPDADSHFRLKPCKCGSGKVAYVKPSGEELWRVECRDCGRTVDKGCKVRHDAQLAWNGGAP